MFGVAGGIIKSREEAPSWVIDLAPVQSRARQELGSFTTHVDLPDAQENAPVDALANLVADEVSRLVIRALWAKG